MRLTANFDSKEFNLKDDADNNIMENIKRLAENMQTIRDWLGKPIIITSGLRLPAHNAKVGGSSTSQHLFGEAVDFVTKDATQLEVIFNAINNGKLSVPNKISQLILENHQGKTWLHMGLYTQRWEEYNRKALAQSTSQATINKHKSRLNVTQFLTFDSGRFSIVGVSHHEGFKSV